MKYSHIARLCGALLACGAAGAASAADSYPDHPIDIIVPFSVGGSTDLVARLEAKGLAQVLNASVLVDNKTGGGGVIGWGEAARAKPDGYTVLTLEMSYTIAPGLIKNLPYDPHKAFSNITTLVQMPHVLVVNPSVPAKTVQEFIALLKANPDKYFFGSGGVGTNTHLGGELFDSLAGVKMAHVPFRGAGAALQDLLAGRVQAMVTSLPTVLSQIRAGKLRALMVASDHRTETLPDVPDAKEAGLPGMNMQFWVGFAVPAKTPRPLVEKLNAAMVKSLSTPDMVAQLKALGLEPVGNTPEQADTLVKNEMVRWKAVMDKAGIKPE